MDRDGSESMESLGDDVVHKRDCADDAEVQIVSPRCIRTSKEKSADWNKNHCTMINRGE